MNDNQRGEDGQEIALEARQPEGVKLYSPSVARNKEPLREVFQRLMPLSGQILEIASGTGEHGAHIAGAIPDLHWQPSDPDATSRASISAWAEDVPDGRMAPPLALVTNEHGWWQSPAVPTDVTGVVCINMIHIAPFSAAEGLFEGAAALLSPGGKLFLYGPFKRRGVTAESNERFDADLKRRDPAWGVRDLDDQIQPLGARFAMQLTDIVEMPANNLSVVFEKG